MVAAFICEMETVTKNGSVWSDETLCRLAVVASKEFAKLTRRLVRGPTVVPRRPAQKLWELTWLDAKRLGIADRVPSV